MVKINKIYTRTGDDGTTGLVGGSRIAKSSLRINALGDLDEANAALGMVHHASLQQKDSPLTEQIVKLQQELFDIGAELATPPDVSYTGMTTLHEEQITQLEKQIDTLLEGIPELRSFILPGGSQTLSALHLARTIVRRAERSVSALAETEETSSLILIYLNRLSDLLFAMARNEASRTKTAELLWVPAGKRGR